MNNKEHSSCLAKKLQKKNKVRITKDSSRKIEGLLKKKHEKGGRGGALLMWELAGSASSVWRLHASAASRLHAFCVQSVTCISALAWVCSDERVGSSSALRGAREGKEGKEAEMAARESKREK